MVSEDIDIKKIWRNTRFFFGFIFLLVLIILFALDRFGDNKQERIETSQNHNVERFRILDVKNGVALVLKEGFYCIQLNKESMLRMIPIPLNKKINSVSLSNKGQFVAIVASTSTLTTIEVLSLTDTIPFKYSIFQLIGDDTKLDSIALKKISGELSICYWNKISWAPDDSKMAFFVKNEQNSYIFTVVFDMNSKKICWVENYEEKVAKRDMKWLSNDKIIVTHNEENIGVVVTIAL